MGVIAKSYRPKNCESVIDPLVNPHEDLTNSVDLMYMIEKEEKEAVFDLDESTWISSSSRNTSNEWLYHSRDQ